MPGNPSTGAEGAVRLYPNLSGDAPLSFPADEIYRHIELPEPPGHRPQVLINAVMSIDGRVAVDGRSGGMGGPADRAAMRNLRSHVDAVLVGAGSLRAEKMDLGVPRGDLEDLRLSRGLSPQPIGIILSRSGNVPLQNLTGTSKLPESPQEIKILPANSEAPDTVDDDFSSLLSYLGSHLGIRRLLVEGGPTVSHALVSAGLLDELFVTLEPKLLAGPPPHSPTLLTGPKIEPYTTHIHLSSMYLARSELFLHYSL